MIIHRLTDWVEVTFEEHDWKWRKAGVHAIQARIKLLPRGDWSYQDKVWKVRSTEEHYQLLLALREQHLKDANQLSLF